jgi:hypothetical protein
MSRAWNEYLQDLEKRILKMYSDKVIFTEYFDPMGKDPGPEVYACGRARCYQNTLSTWCVWLKGHFDSAGLPPSFGYVKSKEEAINWIVNVLVCIHNQPAPRGQHNGGHYGTSYIRKGLRYQ